MPPTLLCRVIAATFLLAFSSAGQGQVLITEFLASNQSVGADEDGDFPDWIELHNPTLTEINLAGWHLTDNENITDRWTFPEVFIRPGEYLVVYASGKDRNVGQLHTNFSLLASGEYLALTRPDHSIAVEFAPTFPPQSTDISYGLAAPTAGAAKVFFTQPTPGLPNNALSTLTEAPTISVPSKTFTAPFSVTLATNVAGGAIRYTTDGTLPQATSQLYVSPLTISQSTRLRAAVVVGGNVVSMVGGETYLQLASDVVAFNSNLPLIIVDNFSGGRPTAGNLAEWMVFDRAGAANRATLTQPPSLTSRTYIKVRGSSTANDAKYSFVVETRDQRDFDRAVAPLGMPSDSDWVMHAPFTYDRSLIRNPLAYRLSNDIGRYAVRTRQVELFLNTDGGPVSLADYFGLYTLMEKITRGDERVDVEKLQPGDLAMPEISGGYIMKIDRADPGDAGISAAGQRLYFVDPKESQMPTAQRTWITNWFNAFGAALNGPDFRNPSTGYAAYLDVPAALDHHILNVVTKNVDALRLSTYFSKDRYGKLKFGPVWDFDRSMDSMDPRDNNYNTWRGETGDLGTDFFRYRWWDRLFADTNFWQQWIDRYAALRRGPLATSNVHAVIDAMAAEINEAQVRNFARWPTAPPRTSFAWEIQHLKNWLAGRLAWIDSRFVGPLTSNAPEDGGGHVAAGFQLNLTAPSLAQPGSKLYYTLDGSDPRLPEQEPSYDLQLVAPNAPAKAWVATADIGTAWRGSATSPDPFDDSAWLSGPGGMGYDDQADYDPFIGINLEAPIAVMKNVALGAYMRVKFNLTAAQLAGIARLELRIRVDDGFAAYFNGVGPIASQNIPTNLTWNSAATALTSDADAVVPRRIDVSAYRSALRVGENVLAIHGLNQALNSSDFLIQAELVAAPPVPELAPSAIEYTGPITIGATSHLIARVFDPTGPFAPFPYTGPGSGNTPVGTRWSPPLPLTLMVGVVPASSQNLAISEIHYHPRLASAAEAAAGFVERDDFEYIVLQNISNHPIDLTGIRFTAGVTFAAGLTTLSYLPPGGKIALVGNPAAFAMRYGNALPVLGKFSGRLNNEGETLIVIGADLNPIRHFTYSATPPWPEKPRTGGFSLVLKLPHTNPDHSIGSNWRASVDPGGELPGVPPTTLAQWRALHFDPNSIYYTTHSAPEADPDGDGLTNLVEFALGTLPTEAQPQAPLRFMTQGTEHFVEYQRRMGTTGVTVQLEQSSNGQTWFPHSQPPQPPLLTGNGLETIRISAPRDAGRALYRVTVSTHP